MTTQRPGVLPRIAVIEDDIDLLDNTVEFLRTQGYPAWGVTSGATFYRRFAVDAVDVVVLDIGLPDENGLKIALHLRELPQLAVIIVSARGTQEDRIAGLRAGADRYLVKPVNLVELIANLEALSRRSTYTPVPPAQPQIEKGDSRPLWRLSIQDWRLTEPGGESIHLTAREFFLMKCLFEANGDVVTRKMILVNTVGNRVLNNNERLDVLIARLRKKCVTILGLNLPIKTMHQVGYVFTSPMVVE